MRLEFPLFIEFDVDGDNTGTLLFSSNDDGIFIDSGNPIRIGVRTEDTAEEWLKQDYTHLVDKTNIFKHPKFNKYPKGICSKCGEEYNAEIENKLLEKLYKEISGRWKRYSQDQDLSEYEFAIDTVTCLKEDLVKSRKKLNSEQENE